MSERPIIQKNILTANADKDTNNRNNKSHSGKIVLR